MPVGVLYSGDCWWRKYCSALKNMAACFFQEVEVDEDEDDDLDSEASEREESDFSDEGGFRIGKAIRIPK